MPPIVSIVGRSESGKTTLIEKLIPELKARGYRIGTIKHTHHAIEFDQAGKDSDRHRLAGAETVILASAASIAMVKNTGTGDLDGLLRYFDDVDLLITEGFKRAARPKIEVIRAAVSSEMMCREDPDLIAVATDADVQTALPRFRLDDYRAIADMIERRFLRSLETNR
jgi:molybdopterin-guanine dinucleotide biosynthesis protein MobB